MKKYTLWEEIVAQQLVNAGLLNRHVDVSGLAADIVAALAAHPAEGPGLSVVPADRIRMLMADYIDRPDVARDIDDALADEFTIPLSAPAAGGGRREAFVAGAEWNDMKTQGNGRPGFYGDAEAEAALRYPLSRPAETQGYAERYKYINGPAGIIPPAPSATPAEGNWYVCQECGAAVPCDELVHDHVSDRVCHHRDEHHYWCGPVVEADAQGTSEKKGGEG
jgi:hypothetical protein